MWRSAAAPGSSTPAARKGRGVQARSDPRNGREPARRGGRARGDRRDRSASRPGSTAATPGEFEHAAPSSSSLRRSSACSDDRAKTQNQPPGGASSHRRARPEPSRDHWAQTVPRLDHRGFCRARILLIATAPGAVTTEAPQWRNPQRGRIPEGPTRPLSRHGDSDALIAAEVPSFLRRKLGANRTDICGQHFARRRACVSGFKSSNPPVPATHCALAETFSCFRGSDAKSMACVA